MNNVKKIKIYTAMRMTGRSQRELLKEAELLHRTLENYGFEVLCPVDKEGLQDTDEPLTQTTQARLEGFWKMDKEMIKEADIILDYMACNKSDGVNKEVGYTRFCVWKPVVRVFPNCGINISRIEDDVIVESLTDAVGIMMNRWGTYDKLRQWRQEMWDRCFNPWFQEQTKMNQRYGVRTQIALEVLK